MDINPGSRGHLLVIPRAHSADLLEIEPEDLDAVARTAQVMARRVKDKLSADGVNLINSCGAKAWQTVFHFHMHVIPRYDGDTLRLPVAAGAGGPRRHRGRGARAHRLDISTPSTGRLRLR